MGRKQRYSRGHQALTDLLAPQEDARHGHHRTTSTRRSDRGTAVIHSPRAATALQHLRQMFPDHEPQVLALLLDSCDENLERAIDAVLRMDDAHDRDRHHDAPTTPATRPPPADDCLWDMLPEVCKEQILAHLNLRDFARIAATSSEFAEAVRQLRSHVRVIKPPPDVSWNALRGMVAAHRNAQLVCVSKWAVRCKHPEAFEQLFAAVHNGSRARVHGVPVTSIQLRNAPTLQDTDVALLCHTLPTLRCLDLSMCPGLTDAAMAAMAQHTAAAVPPPADASASTLGERLQGIHVSGSRRGVTHVRVAGALQVTEAGVKSLLVVGKPSAGSLELLDVSDCPRLGVLSITLAHQHVLSTLMAARCRTLRVVRLTDSGEGRLHRVTLQECPQLHELAVSSRSLTTLNVGGCRSLTSLTLCCAHLAELHAAQCARLEGLHPESECPALQHVNLFMCRSLHSQGLHALLHPATTLATLNLGGCESLTGLHLPTHTNLQEVDAHGCPMLTAVTLDAAQTLVSLRVRKCPRLQSLRIDCTELVSLDARDCGALEVVQCSVQEGGEGGRRRRARLQGCDQLQEASKRTLARLGFVM